ncbi:MAG: hypothetical protein WC917_03570 [Bacilli bacterium]|jgi:ribosomal protein L7/L12
MDTTKLEEANRIYPELTNAIRWLMELNIAAHVTAPISIYIKYTYDDFNQHTLVDIKLDLKNKEQIKRFKHLMEVILKEQQDKVDKLDKQFKEL